MKSMKNMKMMMALLLAILFLVSLNASTLAYEPSDELPSDDLNAYYVFPFDFNPDVLTAQRMMIFTADYGKVARISGEWLPENAELYITISLVGDKLTSVKYEGWLSVGDVIRFPVYEKGTYIINIIRVYYPKDPVKIDYAKGHLYVTVPYLYDF